MQIIKKVINNVPVTYIKTNKFKSIGGRLFFKSPMTKEKMTTNMLLRDIMIDNCKMYNTNEKLNLNCLENYDATYSSSLEVNGNYIINSFNFSSIDEKYVGEGLHDKVVDTFCEIVFNPNIENNEFDKDTFNLCYKKLKESIYREKENINDYCFKKLYELMGSDKPYSFKPEIEILKKQTPKSMYEKYNELINESEISLYLIGDFDYEFIANKITKNIKTNKKYEEDIYVENEYKSKLLEKEEKIDTSSSVLAVGYKCKDLTKYEKEYVMPIYSNILGGGSSSRCFNEIREKNSLAYYCYTTYRKLHGLFCIYAGIKKENKDLTKNLMLKLQSSMNKISDNEIQLAKKDIISYLSRIHDSYVNALDYEYYKDLSDGDSIDIKKENFSKVTIKDVENLHNKIIIDSTFFVKGEK